MAMNTALIDVRKCKNQLETECSNLCTYSNRKYTLISVLVGTLVVGSISALALGLIFGPLAGVIGLVSGAVVGACLGIAFASLCKENCRIPAEHDVSSKRKEIERLREKNDLRLDALARRFGHEPEAVIKDTETTRRERIERLREKNDLRLDALARRFGHEPEAVIKDTESTRRERIARFREKNNLRISALERRFENNLN